MVEFQTATTDTSAKGIDFEDKRAAQCGTYACPRQFHKLIDACNVPLFDRVGTRSLRLSSQLIRAIIEHGGSE